MDSIEGAARASAWWRRVAVWLPLLVCGALLVARAWHYLFFIEDDAFISLRYSQHLLEGRGLTWNDGEYVEGYSNLLWVLGTSLLGLFGMDLLVALRALGLAGALAAVGAVAWAHRAARPAVMLPALAGGFVLATIEHVPLWAVGGLEPCMLAGFLAWALVTSYPLLVPGRISRRAVVVPGVLFGLVCLTRADGPLFAGAACLGLLLVRRPSWANLRLAMDLVAIPVICTLGQVVFRILYYGDPLPNTAHAKLGFSLQRVWDGVVHLGPAFLYAAPVVIAAGWAALLGRRDPETSRRVRFLLVALVLWTAYAVSIGGDTFRGRRHFVPDAVILALIVAQGAQAAMLLGARARRIAWISFAVLGAALTVLQARDARLPKEKWAWARDSESLGLFLRTAFGAKDPLLAVEPAGGMPYYSEMRALDMLGLNDAVLTRLKPETFGTGRVGHELGDGRYTLSRRPDILMFCRPRNDGRACFRGSQELLRRPAFRREHRLVDIEGRVPKRVGSSVWFRSEQGPLGIQRGPDLIEVPGYLMASKFDAVAVLSRADQVVARIRGGQSGGYERLTLPPGQWELTVEHTGMPLQLRVRHEKMSVDTGRSSLPMLIDIRVGHRVELELLNVSQRDALVSRVLFTRKRPG